MRSGLQLEQKVWVIKSKVKEKDKKKRKGIVKYVNKRFVGVWVETVSNSNLGWIEAYLHQDIDNGEVEILPRVKRAEFKIS